MSREFGRSLRRVTASVRLVGLRVVLPRWFARSSLDELLERLSTVGRVGEPLTQGVLQYDFERAERLLRRVAPLPSTCLYVALGRYAVLRREGYPAAFVMGIADAGQGEPGHAWVEVDGRPFAEPGDVSRYRVTFRYPPG